MPNDIEPPTRTTCSVDLVQQLATALDVEYRNADTVLKAALNLFEGDNK